MIPLNLLNVTQYVEQKIGEFHHKKLDKVKSISLKEVLKSKNPYLFKAKNVTQAHDIVKEILDAYISSSEEGIFGNWLERLAIFINDKVYAGRKALGNDIDLDFDRDGQRYLVSIKSGPNWGNGGQIKHMVNNFNTARRQLATSGGNVNAMFVNGCCYGRSNSASEYKSTGNYYKICGQRFWELISGDANLYTELVIPLGHEAEAKNQEFQESYGALVNRLTGEFLADFCHIDGKIDWEKLVIFNSFTPPKLAKPATVNKIAIKKASQKKIPTAHKKSKS